VTDVRTMTFRSIARPNERYASTAFDRQVGKTVPIKIEQAKIVAATVDPDGRWVDLTVEVPHFDDGDWSLDWEKAT
jgi:hypothetical protein